VLEVAAGPAEHAREFARRGRHAIALDLSADMLALASRRARESGVALDVVRADMRDFALERPVDLAFCLIDSVAHLLTLDDLVAHLACVRAAVRSDGTYVIESSHPADMFGDKRVNVEWDSEDGERKAHIRWGAPDDRIDPVTQVTATHVELVLTVAGASTTWAETMPQRFWTSTEMIAAARLAGFTVVRQVGDYEHDVALDDDRAWRMITVLRAP
jgi:SAM-dependent methyltransferase